MVEVPGNDGTAAPLQTARLVPKLNVGVTFGVTVTVKVALVAHCSGPGVNVYVPLPVLLTVAGLQVPVIPLVEVVGSAGTVPPEQIDKVVPKLKDGVRFGATVTVNVVVVAHCPAVGVNV